MQYTCEYLKVTQWLEFLKKLTLNAFKNSTETLIACLNGGGVEGSRVEGGRVS